jgi:hypothetical protein
MRIGTLSLVAGLVMLAVVGGAGVASAEKVKTNQSAELFSRPGESSRILLRIREGQGMTVLAREGRWLKVRVKGRTGYVPRSKVDDVRDDRIARNTRRRPFVDGRSTERGWAGGAPDDRVGADAVDVDRGDEDQDRDRDDEDDADRDRDDEDDDRDRDRMDRDDEDDDDRDADRMDRDDEDDADRDRDRDDEDDEDRDRDRDRDDEEDDRETVKIKAKRVTLYERPNRDSDEVGTARKGDTFYYMREDDGWVMVENDEGDAGWLREDAVARRGGSRGGGRSGGRQIVAMAGVGFKRLGQAVTTPGGVSDPPDNYTLGANGITIAIGGEVLYPYGKQYMIGGSLEYAGSKAAIPYGNADPGMIIHDIDLRVIGGYDLRNARGMVAYGRLGYHYENMSVGSVASATENPARIPSENFKTPTIGAALDIGRVTDKIAARIILDAVVFGAGRVQTRGLEDGSDPSVKGAWLTACGMYKWKSNMTINAAYELTYMTTDFGPREPTSMRHAATGDNVKRKDLTHSLVVMMARAF